MSAYSSLIHRRHFVILLPFLLGSCQTRPVGKSAPQAPAVAQTPTTPAPAKPGLQKEVMTRFSVALIDPASATDGARGAAASLSARIESCWRGPAAPDAPDVTLRVALNQDGTVKTITALDKKAFTTNAGYRAAASAATSAFFKCGPFVLPVSAYAAWKSLDLSVTPHH